MRVKLGAEPLIGLLAILLDLQVPEMDKIIPT
jgi:hypothetical protein